MPPSSWLAGWLQVTRADMKERVVALYKERRNQALSLKDTDSIVKSLEFGLGGLFHFVFAAVYLPYSLYLYVPWPSDIHQ